MQAKMNTEDIHIVMCCWKRYHNLKKQIKMLNSQTVSRRIHLHIVNNNYEQKEKIEIIVSFCRVKYKNIKLNVSHYDNEYFGFQRFIYIRDVLMKKYILDYVIIIDDDQLFKHDWVEKLWELRKPKIYTGWYCKKWINGNMDYWNGSVINMNDCKNNTGLFTNVNYVGTGGSLIDTSVFRQGSPLWKIPNDLPGKVTVYNIEDLWLSYIANFRLGFRLQRSFLPEYISMNEIDKNSSDHALWKTLHEEKQLLFQYIRNLSSTWI